MSEKSMRVAMLYTPLVTAGGAERQMLEEAAQLKRRGHDVQVLTFRLAGEALVGGGIGRDDITVLPSIGGWPGQIISLRRALSRMRADLLVSHTSPELTWLATRLGRAPYVQYHNSPPFYIGTDANPYMASSRYRGAFPRLSESVAGYGDFISLPSVGVRRRLIAEGRTFLKHRALRSARAIVVPSQRTVRELRLLHGVEATVVRGCLPVSLLSGETLPGRPDDFDIDGPIVLSVCRLERQKRVDLLLHAFARVRVSVPDATLVIAGKGAEEKRLRAIARALDLDGAVRFLGYVLEDELWRWYAAADVLAAPAMADFNIAPYEAMAMGCNAVWTTEMETDPEIEASGQVFVAAPEPEPFAQAIVDALRSRPVRRADLRRMTWDARGERIDALFRDAARDERIAA